MNTDFLSLERRYGTPFALKLLEEIARAERAGQGYLASQQSVQSLLRRPSMPQSRENGLGDAALTPFKTA